MKKFILNTLLFSFSIPLIFYATCIYSLYTESYKKTINGSIIYKAIARSKKKHKAKKIILGDSVGEQFFSCYKNNDTLFSLATIESISMVGQYILLTNYINAGNTLDTVYLILNPSSFSNNLESRSAYQFFLKPFFVEEYKSLFTNTVKNQIDKIPFSSICRNPAILTTNWSPSKLLFTLPKQPNKTVFLSPISIEYITKMKALALKNHFALIILPSPVVSSKKYELQHMDKSEITANKLNDAFEFYFNNIIYIDNHHFSDEFHLKEPEKFKKIFIAKLLR